jgi:hypothetical protein
MSDKDYEKDPLHVTNYNLDPEAITDSIKKMNGDLSAFYIKYIDQKLATINDSQKEDLFTNYAILNESKDYDLKKLTLNPLPKRIEQLKDYQELQKLYFKIITKNFPEIKVLPNKIKRGITSGFITHVKDYDRLVANDKIINKMNENLDGAYNRYMVYLESSLPPENRYNMSPDMLNAINFYYLLKASMQYKLDQLTPKPSDKRMEQLKKYQEKQSKYYNTLSPKISPYIISIDQSLQNSSKPKTGGARQRKKSRSTPYRAKSRSKPRTRSKSRSKSRTKK